MTEVSRILVLLLSFWVLIPEAQAQQTLTIGYLQLQDDPRYHEEYLRARYLLEPTGRPRQAAELALRESRFIGSAVGVQFELKTAAGSDLEELQAALDGLAGQGVRFVLLDLPADLIAELAAANRDRELLLFNISAREDRLRQEQCQPNLLHIAPDYAMLADALVQYLVFKKWPRMLVLQGPDEADAQFVTALQRSVKRYGAVIVAVRDYVLSNDPREREQNNVPLITGDAEYDVVFVADANGEFARAVPYQTLHPRPVVGSAGLAASAWHWAWERYGAPQLNKRFEDYAGRDMTSTDWPAWMAVKAIVESVLRTRSTEFQPVRDYLLGDEIVLDGFKGNRLNFRPWNHQLRQPILLVTDNWVVDRAPIRGFLHQTNNMDTLGFDRRDSRCEF